MCRPVAVALIALSTERAVSRSAAIVAKLLRPSSGRSGN
jgi:hypothetical protein